jgi:hypothetical protein
VVNFSQLTILFHLINNGCALCQNKFVQIDLVPWGSCIKIKLGCSSGHQITWESSSAVCGKEFELNLLLPCAAVMSGIRPSCLENFLELLNIGFQSRQYVKENCLDTLAVATNTMWESEMAKRKKVINAAPEFDASFDEQHIRPQRFTSGHARLCTNTVMDGVGNIIVMSHVDEKILAASTFTCKNGSKVKSKAKVFFIACLSVFIYQLGRAYQFIYLSSREYYVQITTPDC